MITEAMGFTQNVYVSVVKAMLSMEDMVANFNRHHRARPALVTRSLLRAMPANGTDVTFSQLLRHHPMERLGMLSLCQLLFDRSSASVLRFRAASLAVERGYMLVSYRLHITQLSRWYLCFALCLSAGVNMGARTAEPSLVSGTVSLDGGLIYHERPRDDGGSIDSDWQLAQARVFLRPHRAVRLGFGLGVSRTAYHATDIKFELPDDVQQAWVRLPVAVMLHEHWGVTVQGSFGTGYGSGASANDGRQWQVQGGPIYRRDDDLIIALLVNVSSRIDDSPTVFPFPSLYWRFHSDWRLTVVDDIDNLSSVRWQVREDLDLGLRVDVRLRDAAIGNDRAFSDDHVAAAMQMTWMSGGRGGMEITPFFGAQLVRRVAVRNSDGEEQWSLITRPAPLGGVNLRASF